MLHYVARTASIRQSLNSFQVFVSYGKPYKVILSATFARWLKAVLSLAGIDSSIFKGHSFRGTSTSKAVSLGVSLDVILKAADWKNAGTFAKFYRRETSSVGQFAQAVLTRLSYRLMLRLCHTNKVLFGEAFIVWCYIYCARESALNYAI